MGIVTPFKDGINRFSARPSPKNMNTESKANGVMIMLF
ncbi:Hypothetical protein I595_2225 [Croceitalea dokdonensis DOKDO 023]|uniref:Uncharacterized protein n=1 Tax=Croceitalea dokdonensis DOKDO 023 TaxID=1300341 RepID=A0A0P7AES5_9FLAO|nr:Hypothetical protein I595_2225 [Croceitalea dokdonensis DOKDO 023]